MPGPVIGLLPQPHDEAALREASGGVTLFIDYQLGIPLEEQTAYTLTAAEANELVSEIQTLLSSS